MAEAFECFVLYDEVPRVDSEALSEFIDSLEPDADFPCEVSEFAMRATEEGSVYSGVVSQGPISVAVQVLGRALPENSLRGTIEVALIAEEDRDRLRDHRVHARLTALGGGDFHPVESMILLLKTGMGLVNQGGLAVANEMNCTCFPGDMLKSFAEHIRAQATGEEIPFEEDLEEEGEEPVSLWDSLRSEGLPGELLIGFLPAEIEGQVWCFTVGHALFGLPDLAYRANDPAEVEEIEEHFRNIFSFLFENGPVISAGHSMGYDGNIAFRFHELPQDFKHLEAPNGTLLVTIDQN